MSQAILSFDNIHTTGFESHKDVLNAALAIGRVSGYTFTTKKSESGHVIELQCVHGGKRLPNHRKIDDEGSKRARLSQRQGCPWKLKAKFHQVDHRWWVVQVHDEHNHSPARDVRVYHQHRKIDEEGMKEAASLIGAGATNSVIVRKLADEDRLVLSKDISNLRPKLATKFVDVRQMIEGLQASGYLVRWSVNEKNELAMLFFAHQRSRETALRFPEVVVLDSTYRTNNLKLPFVNIVGVSNLGVDHLRNFAIAGAWVTSEDEASMTWVIRTLRDVVFDGSVTPVTFVTDHQLATKNAISKIFTDAELILCSWHIERNFATNLRKHFEELDWIVMEASIKSLINCRDKEGFEKAMEEYEAAASNSKQPSIVMEYLRL
jgi:hypothetical protein